MIRRHRNRTREADRLTSWATIDCSKASYERGRHGTHTYRRTTGMPRGTYILLGLLYLDTGSSIWCDVVRERERERERNMYGGRGRGGRSNRRTALACRGQRGRVEERTSGYVDVWVNVTLLQYFGYSRDVTFFLSLNKARMKDTRRDF